MSATQCSKPKPTNRATEKMRPKHLKIGDGAFLKRSTARYTKSPQKNELMRPTYQLIPSFVPRFINLVDRQVERASARVFPTGVNERSSPNKTAPIKLPRSISSKETRYLGLFSGRYPIFPVYKLLPVKQTKRRPALKRKLPIILAPIEEEMVAKDNKKKDPPSPINKPAKTPERTMRQ